MDKDIIPLLLPSEELLAQVRAGFVRQRTSLASWCRERGVKRENVRKVLLGEWTGTKARTLLVELVREARIDGYQDVA